MKWLMLFGLLQFTMILEALEGSLWAGVNPVYEFDHYQAAPFFLLATYLSTPVRVVTAAWCETTSLDIQFVCVDVYTAWIVLHSVADGSSISCWTTRSRPKRRKVIFPLFNVSVSTLGNITKMKRRRLELPKCQRRKSTECQNCKIMYSVQMPKTKDSQWAKFDGDQSLPNLSKCWRIDSTEEPKHTNWRWPINVHGL